MAIDRTAFNALVDDDGGGTTGTVWGKAAIEDVLLDPIDAIKLDQLAVPTDVTTLNASTTAHGLLPKLSNVVTEFLNGQGGYTVPAGVSVTIAAWTPVIGGSGGQSGQTYAAQEGLYLKIDRLVIAHMSVSFSAKGTITGNVMIKGFPFAANSSVTQGALAQLHFANLSTNWIGIQAPLSSGTTEAELQGVAAAGTSNATNLATADITNTTRFRGTFVYITT